MDSPKYSEFNVSATTYKTVNGHDLKTYILVPKKAPKDGKLPIYVKFHGGFLVLGESIFPDWNADWTLQYVLTHNAIFISPNYRLMPESTGTDIASDMSAFWTWLFASLPPYLASAHPGITADLSRICSTGASAGGYLAVQSALLDDQARGRVRAIVAAYPMLDVGSPFFSQQLGQRMMGIDTLPDEVLDGHIANMKSGEAFSAVDPPERFMLAVVMVQRGVWAQYLGAAEELYPMKMVERVAREDAEEGGKAKMPFMFFFHGTDDSSVPVEGTVSFVEKVKGLFGDGTCYLYTGPGEHGFDIPFTLNDPWMKEGLSRVTEAWLGD